nr:hypothetical protein [Tanacetum cinerariifolium]
ANYSAGATAQLSSGNSFALKVAKYSSSGIFITRSGNALEYFILNNPPLNLMLHLQSSFHNQMLNWRGCFNRMKTSEDVSEEVLKGMMQLVPVEEVHVEALQVKHPIIDWEIYCKGKKDY